MAKEQNLPLNPMKISGLCGRLMCCLKYEQEQYVALPQGGAAVRHPGGVRPRARAWSSGYQVPKDALTVRLADGCVVDEPIGGCSCGGAPCRPGEATERAIAVTAEADAALTSAPAGDSGTVDSAVPVSETGAPAEAAVGPAAAGCDIPPWEGILTGITPREERAQAEGLTEDGPADADQPSEEEDSEAGEDKPPGTRRRSRPRRRRRRSGGGGGGQGRPDSGGDS